jgi:cell division control protein 7
MKCSRAGTRGFRAPEVMLQSAHQTIAIDVWSAGVILLTLLSRRYPFFESMTDGAALLEMALVFGTKQMRNLATQLGANLPSVHVLVRSRCLLSVGKDVQYGESYDAQDLTSLCRKLAGEERVAQYPPSVFALLHSLLALRPADRVSAAHALESTFLKSPS